MAHIEKRGDRWRARYRAPDGRERSRTFDRKGDAERFLVGVESDKLTGRWVDPRAGRVTFGDVAGSWLDRHHGTETRTAENIAARVKNHYGCLDGMRIADIRPSDISAWRKGLTARLSNDTINSSHGTLRQVFAAAVQDGIISRNMAAEVKPLSKNKRKEIYPLTFDQVEALADEIDPRYRALILFAALGSGMRAGELWALRVERISFLKPRLVHVVEAVSELSDGRLLTKAPKTGAIRTTVDWYGHLFKGHDETRLQQLAAEITQKIPRPGRVLGDSLRVQEEPA